MNKKNGRKRGGWGGEKKVCLAPCSFLSVFASLCIVVSLRLSVVPSIPLFLFAIVVVVLQLSSLSLPQGFVACRWSIKFIWLLLRSLCTAIFSCFLTFLHFFSSLFFLFLLFCMVLNMYMVVDICIE